MEYLTVQKIYETTADKLNLIEQDWRLNSLQLSVSSWVTFPIALSHFQYITEPTLQCKYMSGTKIALRP
jgi:hypothetical protein